MNDHEVKKRMKELASDLFVLALSAYKESFDFFEFSTRDGRRGIVLLSTSDKYVDKLLKIRNESAADLQWENNDFIKGGKAN